MTETTHGRLAETAARHHGVFSLEEARAAGVTRRSVSNRVRAGRYIRVNPGTYAVGGAPDTTARRLAAAVASFPALTAVSHQTAAELWGMTHRGIRVIEVVTTRWDRVRRADLTVHESLDLLPCDIAEPGGVPVTTAA